MALDQDRESGLSYIGFMPVFAYRPPQRILARRNTSRNATNTRSAKSERSVVTQVGGSRAAWMPAERVRVGLEGTAKKAATIAELAVPPLLGGLLFGFYGLVAGGIFSTAVYVFSDKANSSSNAATPEGPTPPHPPGVILEPKPGTPIDVSAIPIPSVSTTYVEPESSNSYSTSCHAHYPSLTPTGWRVVCADSASEHPKSLTFGQRVYTTVQQGVREWEDDTNLAEVLVEAIGPGVANLGDPPGTTAYQLRVVKVTHTNAGPGTTLIAPGEILVNVPPSFLRTISTWDMTS